MKRNLKRLLKISSIVFIVAFVPSVAVPYIGIVLIFSLSASRGSADTEEVGGHNPVTGLPMSSRGGVDVLGNPFGCD